MFITYLKLQVTLTVVLASALKLSLRCQLVEVAKRFKIQHFTVVTKLPSAACVGRESLTLTSVTSSLVFQHKHTWYRARRHVFTAKNSTNLISQHEIRGDYSSNTAPRKVHASRNKGMQLLCSDFLLS